MSTIRSTRVWGSSIESNDSSFISSTKNNDNENFQYFYMLYIKNALDLFHVIIGIKDINLSTDQKFKNYCSLFELFLKFLNNSIS